MTEEKKSIELPEITKIQLERDLANKKEEVRRNELSVIEHKKVLEKFEDLLPLVESTIEGLYTPESCKVLSPVYEFEKDSRYLELVAKQKSIEHLQLYFSIKDKSIDSLKRTIEAKEAAIKDLKEKIAKMESD